MSPRAVVCFGEALVDFLATPSVDGGPRRFVEYAGGAPANVAVAVARLGGASRFVGMLGEDMFGDMLVEQMRTHGVDLAHARRTAEAKTALAFVSLDAHGERSFSFYRPPAADLLFRTSDFDDGCFENAGAFHICSNSLTAPDIAAATLDGLKRARAAGVLVSMDVNLRPSLWPDGVDPTPRVWQALAFADVVKLSREELDFLSASAGDEGAVRNRLFDANARCIVVTDGAAPVHWWTRSDTGTLPTYPAAVIDTTGAGDAFVGGWLASMLDRGVDPTNLDAFLAHPTHLADTLRFAAACGALATARHGAFAAMPTRTEADRLMRAPT